MAETHVNQFKSLLSEAGNKHHDYEQNELQGVFDENWSTWYAQYILDHGLRDLVTSDITLDQIAGFLAESDKRFREEKPEQSWAEFAAAAMLEKWKP